MIRVKCEFCLEPVYNDGPLGNGDETAALANDGDRIVPFCSAACRSRWFDMPGRNPGHYFVADDVTKEQLERFLPDGTNGEIEWPTREQ